jgi:hypothetical protein
MWLDFATGLVWCFHDSFTFLLFCLSFRSSFAFEQIYWNFSYHLTWKKIINPARHTDVAILTDTDSDSSSQAAIVAVRVPASVPKLMSECPLESPPVVLRPFLTSKKRPHLKRSKILGNNKNIVMGPDGTRHQDWLCWRGPIAIHPPTDRPIDVSSR